MNTGAITTRYATALLKFTLGNGSAPAVAAQVRELLKSPSSAEEELEPDLARFIGLLVSKGRRAYMVPVLRRFLELYYREAGITPVSIVTASPAPGFEDRVREMLEKNGGKSLLIESSTDPSLIGGFRLEYGGKVLDASVRRTLDVLQRRFVEKNNRIV